VVVAAIRQCYSSIGAKELKEKTNKETRERLINQVMASGHTSTLEHASFTFAVEGISRACSLQLVRHRIASYSQQSQRYVSEIKNGFKYVVPPKIGKNRKAKKEFEKIMEITKDGYEKLVGMGMEKEDARFVLPNAAETKIVVTMNARALLNFFSLRCCQRAQWEIRAMAEKMLKEVKKVAPIIFTKAGASCRSQKICWEGDLSCGVYKSLGGELRKRV
jgi:thymidylate synthase (FAD)